GPRRAVEDGLKLHENSGSHGEGENARLSHGGGLSREGDWDRVVPGIAPFVFVKSASFSRPSNRPQPQKTAATVPFSLVSPEWRDCNPWPDLAGAGWAHWQHRLPVCSR